MQSNPSPKTRNSRGRPSEVKLRNVYLVTRPGRPGLVQSHAGGPIMFHFKRTAAEFVKNVALHPKVFRIEKAELILRRGK